MLSTSSSIISKSLSILIVSKPSFIKVTQQYLLVTFVTASNPNSLWLILEPIPSIFI
jgi:hypothetical protein